MTSTYWCEQALVEGGLHESVALTVGNDGRFQAVASDAEAPPDATRLSGLTIPGMANAHSHAFHRALRSRTQAERGTFWTWRELMYSAAERLDPDNYRALARATFAEMAMAGVTCVGEFHYVHHQANGAPYSDPNAMGAALLAAADDAGVRITLLDTLYLHGGLSPDGYTAPSNAQARFSDGSVDRWIDRVDQLTPTDRHRIGAAVHSVRAVDPHAISKAADWARSNHAPIHAHVSEQQAENDQCLAFHGCTPTGLLADMGMLHAVFCAVHTTHMTSSDIDLLAAGQSTVCICPTTERDLGDGIGPTADFAESGVAMALGSDSHAVIDLLEEARCLELHERLRSEGRGIHAAVELMAMATEHGHRALGWADAGHIRVGSRADLVCLDLQSVRTSGSSPSTAVEAAVFAAGAADVITVIADGRCIVEDGRHRCVDVPAELHSSITELLDTPDRVDLK